MKTFTLFKITCLLLVISATSVFAQIPSSGLVGYFPFTGNANDQSGSGITGTPQGGGYPVGPVPTLTADRNSVANSAYNFAPSGYSTSYIDLGMPSQFNFDSTTSFSIALWMKFVDYQVSATMIGNDQWHLGIRNLGGSDHLNLVAGTVSFNSDSLLHPGAWEHVVGVHNRANHTLELYINGKRATGFSYNGGVYGPQKQDSMKTYCALCVMNSMPAIATQIGLIGGTSSTNIKGVLDDVLFYNRALTASEVGNIFTATGGPTGIEQPADKEGFTVTPNPGNSLFYIQLSNIAPGEATLKAYAMDGRLVMEQKNVTSHQPIDLSRFGNGNYLLKLETPSGFYTRKISVTK